LTLHVLDPALEEGRDRLASGVDQGAFLGFQYQAGALDLSLPLRAHEAVPAAFALACPGIPDVENDGPVPWGTFAKMAFHFDSPSIGLKAALATSRSSYMRSAA
jgi:hypothetical protein